MAFRGIFLYILYFLMYFVVLRLYKKSFALSKTWERFVLQEIHSLTEETCQKMKIKQKRRFTLGTIKLKGGASCRWNMLRYSVLARIPNIKLQVFECQIAWRYWWYSGQWKRKYPWTLEVCYICTRNKIHVGAFTINVRRTLRFLEFFTTPSPNEKCPLNN